MSDEKIKVSSIFYDVKLVGKNLRGMTYDVIPFEKDELISQWFHADPQTDLFIWFNSSNNIIRQQLSFNGMMVEWNCLEGLKTGFLIESELNVKAEPETQAPINSESISFDLQPIMNLVQMAISILESMSEQQDIAKRLLHNFKNPQTIHSMSPKDFINRYGAVAQSSDGENKWDSFKNFLTSFLKK